MKSMQPAVRRAISYIRFSSGKQADGESLRRQTTGTVDFCKRHNLFLDEKLTVRDLGKSAFKGKNADSGKLSIFLEAVRAHKVPAGTVLVVEALDRLTRNSIVEATHLLTDILRHGIDLGLITEDKIYSLDYVNKNPFELLVATTYLIRGGDESRMKSDRTTKNWVGKMKDVAGRIAVKVNAPCWLEFQGDKGNGKWVIIEEKAKVIRKLFADYLHGDQGIWMLTHQMNEAKVPVITKRAIANPEDGGKWHRITMHRILTNKAAMGTYEFIEPPVEGYYPAIVTEKDFYAVQNKLTSRIRKRGRSSLNDISLFRGICTCAKCGSTMTRVTRTRDSVLEYRYLYCHNAILGLCRPSKSVDLTKLETAFMQYTVGSTTAKDFFGDKPKGDEHQELDALNVQIADKAARVERLRDSIEAGSADNPKSVVARIATLENEVAQLRVKQQTLTAEQKGSGDLEADMMDFYLSRPNIDALNSPARLKLRELINRWLKSMVVDAFDRTAKFTTIAGNTRTITWEKTVRKPRSKPLKKQK